jgi:hypothetical protein
MTKEEYKALSDALDICVLHKADFNYEELQIVLKASQVLTNIQCKRIETNEKTARIIAEKRKVNKNYARGIKE